MNRIVSSVGMVFGCGYALVVGAGEIRVSPGGLSPHAALEKIRAAKAAGDRSAWTVRVVPGLYAFDRTLVFTPDDSGTPEASVRWIAEGGEALFSGGGLIGGWRDAGDGVWEAPLPRDAAGRPVWFQSLYANGRRAQRARLPEKGFFSIAGWHETATTNGAAVLYHEHYTVKDRAADALTGLSPKELNAVEFQIRCKWSYGSYSVLAWNPVTRELSADGAEGVKSWKRPDERGTLFAFENVRAGFDTPGEWFYDVTEGKVKYRPLPGETLENFKALAPLSQLVSIIRFDGDPEHGRYVTDISFDGITVTGSRTDGDRLASGFVQQYQYQAGSWTGGSVYAKGAWRLAFENCRIFGVENYAMRFDIGCVSNRIANCTFEDLGAGGLWIGSAKPSLFRKPGGWKETRTAFTRPIPYGDPAVAKTHPCAFFTVEDCTIRRAGLVNPEGCGIVLTHVSDSSVTHCDISDLYYTGISVGWTWGYSGSVSQRNTIAFNHIWDLGKHVMADMGGIYTLGTSYGTCISNNVVHHVDSVSYGGWGLYNDEGSEGIVWENNLVYDTKDSSYHQHYGRENVVRNNILACSKESQIAVSRPEQHLCVSFLNNLVYWETKTPVFSSEKKPVSEGAGKLAWTNNVFWCAAGPTVINGPVKAIVCDPLFMDAPKRDFRLKPDSPVLQYGFRPFDVSKAGRRISEKGGQIVALPGEPCVKAPIPCSPFPDRLSAYVWRNWNLVPVERLASIVGTIPAELEQVAADMGLGPAESVLPEWRRKGYITLLRRNWHLLPYEQLTELVDMTRAELAFSLAEDDFLWVKLGKVKPRCERLVWTSDDRSEERRMARKRIAAVLAEEKVDPRAPEEPRFSFIPILSQVDGCLARNQAGNASPFDFRLIFSYFADYGDPLGDPEIRSYPEGLLQKLSRQGVNAVWLHTVLRTLAKDPKYPEWGEGSERRIANLKKLVARAAKYGIKIYLYLNEPRGMDEAFFKADPRREAFRGAPSDDIGIYSLCPSNPEPLRWLSDSIEQVFGQVPGLGGIFTISMSENMTHCKARKIPHPCVRCKDRPAGDIIVAINRALIEGMRRGNPKAEAILYTWNWPENEVPQIMAKLPKEGCRIMTVSENGMTFSRGGVQEQVADYSISVVGPGEPARRIWNCAAAEGLPCVAKVQVANSWELSSFPYLPVDELNARHAVNLANAGVKGVMLSWSCGCYPAPNLAVYRDLRPDEHTPDALLDRLAASRYGAANISRVRKAWKAFADGFSEFPFNILVAYLGPQQWGVANPLYLEKTGYSATMVGIPYDDVKGWCGGYPPEVFASQMDKVADGFAEGCRAFEGIADTRELNMFKAQQMHFASSAAQVRFVLAREAGDSGSMRRIAMEERQRALAYLPWVRADSRIGYESSNHYFFLPRDLIEKVLVCRQIEDRTSSK